MVEDNSPGSRSRLHHIGLGARDVEEVARFYREVLDLEECGRHLYGDGRLRSVWLDTGGVILMVEHTRQERDSVEGVGAGPFLLAFTVADEAAREAMEARLGERGADIESRTDYSSYFRDPEGNRVAVSYYPFGE
jgi:glyoxylase I family protein